MVLSHLEKFLITKKDFDEWFDFENTTFEEILMK